MKYNGMIIFILTAFVLISMASVCASDVDNAALAGEDTHEMELSANDEIGAEDLQTNCNSVPLTQTNNDEPVRGIDNGTSPALQDGLSEGEGTYSELKTEIGNGKNISLNKSYYRYDSGNSIEIINPCVIDGNGAVIDMEESDIRAFCVSASGVTINNLTIINVKSAVCEGAAVYFADSGTVTNCNFGYNKAIINNGGALYFGGNGEVRNCNFTNNTALVGGAIYFDENARGTVINCTFDYNKATIGDGGAVYFDDGAVGTVINCTFDYNGANNGDGGAIYMFGGSVENCNFTENFVYEVLGFGHGGAVYWKGKEGNLNGCNFIGNNAPFGGAIYWDGYYGTVSNSNFERNNAHSAGAVDVSGDYVSITGCNFTGNSAFDEDGVGYGGAISLWSDYANITNCIFTGDKASIGGAVYCEQEFFTSKNGAISNCSFTDNVAADGGAIYWKGENVKVISSVFINNRANGGSHDGNGGSAYFENSADVINCRFADNKAISRGGAVYFHKDSAANVVTCNFNNNSAGVAGAIYFTGADSMVSNCTFVSNSAGDYGAVHLSFGESFISRCIFVNNTAGKGVVGDAWESHMNLEISNSIFLNNDAGMNVVDFADNENVVTDYNWFGNVVDDYDAGVPSPSSNIWLFLNATADPDSIPIFSSSNITFMLRAYNKTAIMTFDYDNSLLKQVNLTITQTKGKVGDVLISPGDSVQYTAVDEGIGSVTAAIENVAYTIKFNNVKANPGLSAEDQVSVYGENATIALSYNPNATGKVNITLTGKKYNMSYENLDLKAEISLQNDIPADEYNVTVTYSGDGNFTNATANAALTVNKANSTLTVNGMTFDYKGKGSTKASFSNAAGITAKVVNKPKAVVTIKNNVITVSGLDAGTYTLSVTTVTDDNHNAVTKTAKITVRKLKTTLTGKAITAIYNVNKNLVVTLKDSKGNPLKGVQVSISLNGVKKLKTNSKGQVKVSTKGLAPKTYTAKATFNGNANYAKSTKSVKVLVKKATPKIVVKAKAYAANTQPKLCAVVLKDNTGKAIKKATLSLNVGGNVYKATTDNNGKATFKITQLTKKGTYVGVITYNGDKYSTKLNKNVKITVKQAPYVKPTFKTVSEGSNDVDMVKKIQIALKNHGYYLTYDGHYLMIDGYYGSCTARSVGEFQQDNGLTVTGQVDEATARKLGII